MLKILVLRAYHALEKGLYMNNDDLRVRANALVNAIQGRLKIVLPEIDRQNIIEKAVMLKGKWREVSIDKLTITASLADELLAKLKKQPPDPAMGMAGRAIVSDVKGDRWEIRRFQALRVFGLVCAVIKGLEGEKS